ncbi:Contains similarity to PRO2134 mRNA from Homo sapiens gb/AF118094 [Arabidopsis thaliana]|nr:Contains similarity to PRO2134 mRNA from Homo sapiens gb/AF118094 [Arabidopsis thaliana]
MAFNARSCCFASSNERVTCNCNCLKDQPVPSVVGCATKKLAEFWSFKIQRYVIFVKVLLRMKHSKDPFEAAMEEQEESPVETEQTLEGDERAVKKCKTSVVAEAKNKDEVEFTKNITGADPVTRANKMQKILSQFTEEQMSRYESFRRSGFKKSDMEKLVQRITGGPKMDDTMNIVVRGIAKMFVGDLVETARVVMRERKESGPIRPCHIRESYRRLKLQGKVPQRSVQRLFR